MSRTAEITLKMLHAFLTWAESGTEQEAAQRLGITQPAVHRKLEKFQTEIGTGPRLLQRGPRGWELTDSGQAVLPVIRDLVRRFEQLESHLSNRDIAPRKIRIGTGSFAAQYFLPPAIAQVRQKLPACQIETHLERGRSRILLTADARLDLAIVTHSAKQVEAIVRKHFPVRRNLVECELLAQYSLCVAAKRGSLEARTLARVPVAGLVSIADLAPWRLVGLDPQSGLRQRLEQLAEETQLTFAEETAAGGWPAAKAYALQGLGVAILPIATLVAQDCPEFVIRKLDERFVVEEYLISRGDFADSACDTMKAALRSAAAAHCKQADVFWKQVVSGKLG